MRVRSFPFPVSLLEGECSAILPLDSFALFGGIPADGSKTLSCLKEKLNGLCRLIVLMGKVRHFRAGPVKAPSDEMERRAPFNLTGRIQ